MGTALFDFSEALSWMQTKVIQTGIKQTSLIASIIIQSLKETGL